MKTSLLLERIWQMGPYCRARMTRACDGSKFTAAFDPFYAVTWGTPKYAPPRRDNKAVNGDREYVFFSRKVRKYPFLMVLWQNF